MLGFFRPKYENAPIIPICDMLIPMPPTPTNETKCTTCGKYSLYEKRDKYLITKDNEVYDAVDCMRCGCQNILAKREKRMPI